MPLLPFASFCLHFAYVCFRLLASRLLLLPFASFRLPSACVCLRLLKLRFSNHLGQSIQRTDRKPANPYVPTVCGLVMETERTQISGVTIPTRCAVFAPQNTRLIRCAGCLLAFASTCFHLLMLRFVLLPFASFCLRSLVLCLGLLPSRLYFASICLLLLPFACFCFRLLYARFGSASPAQAFGGVLFMRPGSKKSFVMLLTSYI